MSSKTPSEILAEKLALQYNPNRQIPFPFENIEKDKKELHITYSNTLPDEVSGGIVYVKKDKEFKIAVNAKKSETRQYFTMAHEIGHYFLHRKLIMRKKGIVDGDPTLSSTMALFRQDMYESTIVETEANQFAASLIMPEDVVRYGWSELPIIEECAKIFRVSISAMSIRLERLGLLPV